MDIDELSDDCYKSALEKVSTAERRRQIDSKVVATDDARCRPINVL